MSLDADIPGQKAAPAQTGAPGRPRYTWEHAMRSNGVGRKGYVVDSYTVSFHGNATTHLDSLSHFTYGGKIYNGFPGDGHHFLGSYEERYDAFQGRHLHARTADRHARSQGRPVSRRRRGGFSRGPGSL